jgi:very-short-patch-repair endonuclease
MMHYRPDLKAKARKLRADMTDAEQKLWFHLRRKQLHGVQFYRQRPIGSYIADFCAPAVNLIIEVDGAQHAVAANTAYDAERSAFLASRGYEVIRFDNLQVLGQLHAVLETIHHQIATTLHRLHKEIA